MSRGPFPPDDGGLGRAARALREGGVVAFPTDTVLGLACLPEDRMAVQAVYLLKGRPEGLPLILMAAEEADLEPFCEFGPIARELARRFWPGALTLVLKARDRAALLRGAGSLGVRVPDHQLARRLLRLTGPLATTSANPHGRPPLPSAEQALRELPGLAGALDDLPQPRGAGRPSSILDLTQDPPVLLREGAIAASELGLQLAPPDLGSRRD